MNAPLNGPSNGNRARLIHFRDFTKGSLIGFARMVFPSGLVIGEIGIHRHGNTCWAAPPARLRLRDGSSEPLRDAGGKLVWSNDLISFETPDIRRRWSAAVIEAIRRDRPHLLGELQAQLPSPQASGQEVAS
jgi:hypothetical protein